MSRPAKDWLVGSKPWYQSGLLCRALLVEMIVTTVIPATVISRVHRVERRVAILTASARMTCLRP